jgi:transcriptional regulator with XRE-family HTH domain
MSGFAIRLKELREKAGLSQAALAELAGMNRFGIAKLEQGAREPSWSTVQAIARALGVSCEAFANFQDVSGPMKARTKPGRRQKAK